MFEPNHAGCAICGGFEGLQPVTFLRDLDENFSGSDIRMCIDCLRTNDLYCEQHGPKLCMHWPELSNGSAIYTVTCTCVICARQKVLAMNSAEMHKHFNLLQTHSPEMVRVLLENFESRDKSNLTKEQAVMHSVLYSAELHGRTLEEAVADIISGRTNHQLN